MRVIPGERGSVRPGTQDYDEDLGPGSRDALHRLAGMTRRVDSIRTHFALAGRVLRRRGAAGRRIARIAIESQFLALRCPSGANAR
jgi:hypothetical protein